MKIEVFEEQPDCWAYRVEGTYQPFDPELSGHVSMSKERAEFLALQEAARLTESMEPVEVPETVEG